MSLTKASYDFFSEQLKQDKNFKTILIERVTDLIDKCTDHKKITVADLINLYPSNIERNVEQYKNIME